MKLDELSNYSKDLNRTKLVYGLITLVAVACIPVMYYLNLQKIAELTAHPIVVDNENYQYLASRRGLSKAERNDQYVLQAREFWFLMWNMEKGSYQSHLDSALELAGTSGEKLYEDYFVEKGFERLIIESNYKSENIVLDCTINSDTIPHTGVIRSKWTIIRPEGKDVRNLNATFTVRDVGYSHKNPLGVELDNIDIFDNTRWVEKK